MQHLPGQRARQIRIRTAEPRWVSQVNGVGTVSNGSDTAVTDGLTAALAAWREDHEAVQLRQDSQGAGEVANSFTPVFTSSVDASYLGARQIPLLASITTPIAQTVPAW